MTIVKPYSVGAEDKVELFEGFIKRLIDADYTTSYIGEALALVSRALDKASTAEVKNEEVEK